MRTRLRIGGQTIDEGSRLPGVTGLALYPGSGSSAKKLHQFSECQLEDYSIANISSMGDHHSSGTASGTGSGKVRIKASHSLVLSSLK